MNVGGETEVTRKQTFAAYLKAFLIKWNKCCSKIKIMPSTFMCVCTNTKQKNCDIDSISDIFSRVLVSNWGLR
jgi:hypothetical protein